MEDGWNLIKRKSVLFFVIYVFLKTVSKQTNQQISN